MNSLARVFLLTGALLFFAGSAFSGQDDCCKDHLIKVTGQSEIRVVPDEVILSLGIETWNKEVVSAKNENDKIIDQILGFVKSQGIDSKYCQTDVLRINPRYKKDYEKEVFLGYFVTRRLVITVKDLTKFTSVLTGTLQVGATQVHGIDLRTSELRKYRDQARSLACKAAEEKATSMAGVLGRKLAGVHEIIENFAGADVAASRYARMSQNVATARSGDFLEVSEPETFSPGQISIQSTVTVTFLLE
jgi:uncharacterized protein YggE